MKNIPSYSRCQLNIILIFQAAAEVCPDACLAIISNPVNSTVPIASEMFKKAGKYVQEP